MFSLESPHRGDSNEYTQYAIFPKLSQICSCWILFQGTQEGVRNSRGKRVISVRVIKVLLYMFPGNLQFTNVIQADSQNGSIYFCVSTNPVTQHPVQSSGHKIIVHGSKYPATSFTSNGLIYPYCLRPWA